MAKKQASSPAWLATFADLMSLLMALFVLLYAMSSIEVPKYQAVVESLNEALGNGSELSPEQEQFFQSLKQAMDEKTEDSVLTVQQKTDEKTNETVVENLQPFYESLIETYAEADQKNEIKIQYDSETDEIQLIFPEQIAFDPGRSALKPRFRQLLDDFFDFKSEAVGVKVIGHTDSRPVSGGRFRSNWELSSARASSVIQELIRNGSVLPQQAQAIGVADTAPVAMGNTERDYALNRRVEILVTPTK